MENISYVIGDLRKTGLKDESFEGIACISTLEHIGMDNTFIYSKEACYKESNFQDYKLVLREFKRLLKPRGKLFITVPYGCYENHGWLQQFNEEMVGEILNTFSGSRSDITYYRYFNNGWQVASSDSCRDCSYFDINNSADYEPDYAAAARAVACIEIVK